MKLVTCNRCQSQFDVATMQAGSTFVCGKCRNVLHVPAAPPVMAPIQTVQPVQGGQAGRPGQNSPPPTVALSPDEMRRALQSAKAASPPAAQPAPSAKGGPKLPAAMEARRQTQTQGRAGGATAPAPAAGGSKATPPNTVVLSPAQMKAALAESGPSAPADGGSSPP